MTCGEFFVVVCGDSMFSFLLDKVLTIELLGHRIDMCFNLMKDCQKRGQSFRISVSLRISQQRF